VVYSSYKVPGEGEHKIIRFINEMILTPNYDPNTSIVLTG